MTRRATPLPDLPLRQRLKGWALSAAFLLGGVSAVWLALTDLLDVVHRLATRAPTLEFAPIDARALFAGLALLVFAAMMLLPAPDWARGGPRRRRRRMGPAPVDWAMVLMGTAFACLLLCVVSPPILTIAVGEVAARRGFRLCPSPADEHRPPLRWVRAEPLDRCPRSWRDADAFAR